MTAYFRRIAQVPVDPLLLKEAAEAVDHALESGRVQGEHLDPTFVIATRFRGRRLSTDTLMAIILRMEALSELITMGELKNWQIADAKSGGAVVIDGTVFKVAAEAQLIEGRTAKSTPRFKPLEFRDLLLKFAVSSDGGTDGSH